MSRNQSRRTVRVRQKLARTGTLATLLMCAVAGGLLTAGPASAASRRFTVHNESSQALRLEAAKPVPSYSCVNFHCVPSYYPMDFEGRPSNGAMVDPETTQAWELKWSFSLFGGVQYAANVVYRIMGTNATVEYEILTYTTSNDSSCKVTGTSSFTCTAEGTKLTFRNH
jgi:hypothetical protein